MGKVRQLLYRARPQLRINNPIPPIPPPPPRHWVNRTLFRMQSLLYPAASFYFYNHTDDLSSHFPQQGFWSVPGLVRSLPLWPSLPDGRFPLSPITWLPRFYELSQVCLLPLLPIFPALKFSILIYRDLSLTYLLRGSPYKPSRFLNYLLTPYLLWCLSSAHRYSRPYDFPRLLSQFSKSFSCILLSFWKPAHPKSDQHFH